MKWVSPIYSALWSVSCNRSTSTPCIIRPFYSTRHRWCVETIFTSLSPTHKISRLFIFITSMDLFHLSQSVWPDDGFYTFNFLSIYNHKNCPIVYKIHWSQSEFLPNTKQILIKLPKDILVYAKVAKFHQIWSHWILSPPPLPLPFSMFVSLSKSFSHKFPFSSHTQSRVLDSQSTFIAF